jgi:murein DD-endopeptidase MepM/ murein hydrolase activator NlpD
MKIISRIVFILMFSNLFCIAQTKIQLPGFKIPVLLKDRSNIELIKLTKIGNFGEKRKERISIPSHLHTGIDIIRPSGNYENEPVFSICQGIVISVRNDGPFAQVIIEHALEDGNKIWSVYEHIACILVNVGEHIDSNKPIARFMNKTELNKYGWQFDHFHFEILKVAPKKVRFNPALPHRFYATYNLECYTPETLNKYYFDPIKFFQNIQIVNNKNLNKK